jgi:hypothetical protein
MSHEPEVKRLPTGWLATAIGGTLGAAALGAATFFGSLAYFDRQPDSDLGDLGWAFLWAALGIYIGGVLGAAFALRLRNYDRAVVSGVLFAALVTALLLGWAFLAGQVMHTWDEGLLFFLAITTSVGISAWAARKVFSGRFPGGPGAGSAPPG